MSGGGGATTQVVKTNLIPSWAENDTTSFVSRSFGLGYTGDYSTTGLSTYATRNVDETDGLTKLAAYGITEFVSITKGRAVINANFAGTYLNNNPKVAEEYTRKVEAIVQVFNEETMPNIDTSASLAGHYGSSVHNAIQSKAAEAMIAKISEIAKSIYGVDYYQERGHQQDSVSHAFNYAAESLHRPEILRKVGMMGREYRQHKLNDNYKRYFEIEDGKVKALNIKGNAIRAMVGAASARTEPLYMPPEWVSVAGMAMAGIGMYGQIMNGAQSPMQLPAPTNREAA